MKIYLIKTASTEGGLRQATDNREDQQNQTHEEQTTP